MDKFSWYEAKSVEDALDKVNSTASDILGKRPNSSSVIFKAGGIDLIDLMKEGLVQPAMIVGIKNIPGLDAIDYNDKEGLKLGANVTLTEMEENKVIREKYFALHQAVSEAGTAQLRNSATLGGNLAQRTRCWYFRSLDHQCYRKGSGTCFAQEGENEFHSIIRNKPCASVHSSSVSTALLAFGASVEIAGAGGNTRMVPMSEFFVHPEKDSRTENVLSANEIIIAVHLPEVKEGTRSYYIKQGARESHDWAMADVAVVLEMSGATCKEAALVLGAAAPVPLLEKVAAAMLVGNRIDEKLAAAVGEKSMEQATPLEHNAYKVPVFKAIIKRAILKAV